MLMGPPGSGKSTLAVKYALAAANRGEKVLQFIFDETISMLTARAKQLGMDLDAHLKSGVMKVEQVDPAEISPGELAHRIKQAVLEDQTRMVIIDSINGYLNAMPGARYLNLQLHELLAFLNQQGVITIMVLAQQGLIGNMQTNVDLTYLSDSVMLLRYFEDRGCVKQALAVIKKRGGNHERTIREFEITQKGLRIGKPLTDLQGVLTGVPFYVEDKDEMKRMRREA